MSLNDIVAIVDKYMPKNIKILIKGRVVYWVIICAAHRIGSLWVCAPASWGWLCSPCCFSLSLLLPSCPSSNFICPCGNPHSCPSSCSCSACASGWRWSRVESYTLRINCQKNCLLIQSRWSWCWAHRFLAFICPFQRNKDVRVLAQL